MLKRYRHAVYENALQRRLASGGGPPVVTFDTLTLPNSGSNDVFVCGYTDAGRLRWAARLAGTGDDQGLGISTDSSGNVYVVGGYTSSPLTIYNANGGTFGTLANAGSNDVFVVKYNTSGTVQWATRLSSGSTDIGFGISTDGTNVYVTGYYAAALTIYNANGGTFGTLPFVGGVDAFVVKYDKDGIAQWATRLAGASTDAGFGISADALGNVYLTGFYTSNPMTIYDAPGTASTIAPLPFAGTNDAFVVKYNTSGIAQWAARLTGAVNDQGYGISVDSTGNVYMTGFYDNPMTINNGDGTTFGTLANTTSTNDVFVVKYNTSGTAQWATRLASGGNDQGLGISTDGTNVYVTGLYSNTLTIYDAPGTTPSPTVSTLANAGSLDVFVVKYNTSGIAQWATRLAGPGTDVGQGISTDSIGNVYVTGLYNNTLAIYDAPGTTSTLATLANSGSNDVFVVKYNTSGIAQWATRLAGAGAEAGLGISVGNTGNVYSSGQYTSNPLTLRSVGF